MVRDSYDVENGDYVEHDMTPCTFYSYWNAQKTVAAAPYTYYNNKHDILNEFTYKCNARFPCSKCSKKTDTKCIPCGNAYICVRCHTHTELAGDDIKTFKQSLVLRLDELTAVKKTAYLQKRGTRFLFEQRTERIRGGGTTRGITLGRASHRSHRDGRGCLNKSLLLLFRNEIVLFFFSRVRGEDAFRRLRFRWRPV